MRYEEQGLVQQFRGIQDQETALKELGRKDMRQKGQLFIIQLCAINMQEAKPQISRAETTILKLL